MDSRNDMIESWLGPFDLRDFMDPDSLGRSAEEVAALERGGVYAWYDRSRKNFAYFGRSFFNVRKRQLQHLAGQAGLVQSHWYEHKHGEKEWRIDWDKADVRDMYREVDRFVEQVRHAFTYLESIDVWVFPMEGHRGEIKNSEKFLLEKISPYGTRSMGVPDMDMSRLQDALLSIRDIAIAGQRNRN